MKPPKMSLNARSDTYETEPAEYERPVSERHMPNFVPEAEERGTVAEAEERGKVAEAEGQSSEAKEREEAVKSFELGRVLYRVAHEEGIYKSQKQPMPFPSPRSRHPDNGARR